MVTPALNPALRGRGRPVVHSKLQASQCYTLLRLSQKKKKHTHTRILEPGNLAPTHGKQRKEDLKASLEYRAGLYLQTIATTHSHTKNSQS